LGLNLSKESCIRNSDACCNSACQELIGAITLSGSFIAFAKLQGLKIIPDKPVSFKFDLVLKLILLVGLLG
jgi:NAD/NADP transhydrogenase beta subunit